MENKDLILPAETSEMLSGFQQQIDLCKNQQKAIMVTHLAALGLTKGDYSLTNDMKRLVLVEPGNDK